MNIDKNTIYEYDASGRRISKTINGAKTEYVWSDGKIIEERLPDGSLMGFQYDAYGNGMGFDFYDYEDNSMTFFYFIKNLQGDVVALTDRSGNIVAEYSYDAWGNVLTITGSRADTLGRMNPMRYRGYYYDSETGFYYLNSRYYDPEIGRFINADGYVSTGQDTLGYNMFAYCGNNPVNRIDPTGSFWSSIFNFVQTAISEIGKAFAASAPVYAGVGSVALVDGPLPFGDTIAGIGAIATTVGVIANGINQTVKIQTKAKEKEKDKAVAISVPKQNNGNTYYHVTTPTNAAAITATGVMTGSSWEGGYVYAWRSRPSKYAIRNSGAHFGTIISFKTNASFSTDSGIVDPKVQMYGPVVSTLPGPIVVWDVQIVGVTR